MWDLCSLTRDWTCTPALTAWSLNHWTAREVLGSGGFYVDLWGTSLVAQMVKASAYNAGDPDLITELGRSPGEGNGNPPWTVEPSRLQSMGSQRVGHNWATSLSLHFETLCPESPNPILVLSLLTWLAVVPVIYQSHTVCLNAQRDTAAIHSGRGAPRSLLCWGPFFPVTSSSTACQPSHGRRA